MDIILQCHHKKERVKTESVLLLSSIKVSSHGIFLNLQPPTFDYSTENFESDFRSHIFLMGLPPLTPYKPLSFKEFLYHTTSKRVGGGRRVIHPSPTLNTVNRKVQFSSRSSFMNPLNYTQRTRNSTHHYVTYHQI